MLLGKIHPPRPDHLIRGKSDENLFIGEISSELGLTFRETRHIHSVFEREINRCDGPSSFVHSQPEKYVSMFIWIYFFLIILFAFSRIPSLVSEILDPCLPWISMCE